MSLLLLVLQVLAGLTGLHELALLGAAEVTTHQLRPLTACKHLTRLGVDGFVVLPPPDQPNPPVGSSAPAAVSSPHTRASPGLNQQGFAAGLEQAFGQLSMQQPGGASGRAVKASSGCLPRLQHLDIGNQAAVVYHAPLTTFAPGITQLHDVRASALFLRT